MPKEIDAKAVEYHRIGNTVELNTTSKKPTAKTDLFGGSVESKPKRKGTTTRMADCVAQITKLKRQIQVNPHPYLLQALEGYEKQLEGLKKLSVYD